MISERWNKPAKQHMESIFSNAKAGFVLQYQVLSFIIEWDI